MPRASYARITVASGFRLVREPGPASVKTPVRYPKDVYQLMAPIAALEPAEVFWIIPLDSQRCSTFLCRITSSSAKAGTSASPKRGCYD